MSYHNFVANLRILIATFLKLGLPLWLSLFPFAPSQLLLTLSHVCSLIPPSEPKVSAAASELAALHHSVCMHAKSLQLCPTLCNPMDIAQQAPLSLEILQTRILEWASIPSTRGWDQFSSVAQSCLTLCDLMNRSTPGLPVHHQGTSLPQMQV